VAADFFHKYNCDDIWAEAKKSATDIIAMLAQISPLPKFEKITIFILPVQNGYLLPLMLEAGKVHRENIYGYKKL
jgi:hypothetical protein